MIAKDSGNPVLDGVRANDETESRFLVGVRSPSDETAVGDGGSIGPAKVLKIVDVVHLVDFIFGNRQAVLKVIAELDRVVGHGIWLGRSY